MNTQAQYSQKVREVRKSIIDNIESLKQAKEDFSTDQKSFRQLNKTITNLESALSHATKAYSLSTDGGSNGHPQVSEQEYQSQRKRQKEMA